MVTNKQTNLILTGYRSAGIELYKTDIKPLGRIVAGVGVVCLAVAVFPNGLGVFFYPLGFSLLGLVGVKIDYKQFISNKIRLAKYRFGLF